MYGDLVIDGPVSKIIAGDTPHVDSEYDDPSIILLAHGGATCCTSMHQTGPA
jgi:hypothetical protein